MTFGLLLSRVPRQALCTGGYCDFGKVEFKKVSPEHLARLASKLKFISIAIRKRRPTSDRGIASGLNMLSMKTSPSC